MSHKATSWLSEQTGLSASEFRVLFHLCDCHNPAKGCFPTQEYLIEKCEVSNGTLNNALNALEQRGFLKRIGRHDPETKKRRPTFYILGFDLGKPQEPSPEIGDGAISKKTAKPSPIFGKSHLQPTGDKPVIGTCNRTSKHAREENDDLFSENPTVEQKPKDRFDDFWSVYPKKAGKPAAQKAWAKAIKRADPQAIIDGARRYARSDAVERGFAKHPQGWLNDDRWNDTDLPPLPVAGAPSSRVRQNWGEVVR